MMNLRVFCFPKSSEFQGKDSINCEFNGGFSKGGKLCKLERGQIMQQWQLSAVAKKFRARLTKSLCKYSPRMKSFSSQHILQPESSFHRTRCIATFEPFLRLHSRFCALGALQFFSRDAVHDLVEHLRNNLGKSITDERNTCKGAFRLYA